MGGTGMAVTGGVAGIPGGSVTGGDGKTEPSKRGRGSKRAGYVMADALVPLMFWLGLTKSRMSALETLRMGFGSLQIDTGALLVMGEHVEVQMRLVEGLRHLSRRDSLDQLCEYITGNSFQRLRAWFNSMRSDQFGCVDITQVQSLFARMEGTTDRQELFPLCGLTFPHGALLVFAGEKQGKATVKVTSSKIRIPQQFQAETTGPGPTWSPSPSQSGSPQWREAKDPREAMAIEKKKFSLHG
eukprot:Skav234631  [mRNA]  locus=scaffold1609:4204:9208:+ [translate_table: standard]